MRSRKISNLAKITLFSFGLDFPLEFASIKILSVALTFLKIICFPNIDQDQSHQLELGESLSGGGWDGKQVSQLVDLVVDAVPPHLAGALRRLGPGVITENDDNDEVVEVYESGE